MRVKLKLTKNICVKTSISNQGPWRKSEQWQKKYEKCQFCTQRRQRIQSSHKISKNYNEH